ncbi:MAG: GH3 auxin-responsive promoter family protein [Bacteroidia bacterium]|nr:GH3 auxin-responsive promoter family protein [Bacteroidia bacterium]MCF8426213.1 GH3 auxin-responsive promoter family protein [Bacteroidia bacterium]MCF8446245.1 GH3 auxin-responsive promoter family protein [Bacteroidia bacterium]
MGIKAILAKPFARYISGKVKKESEQALFWQETWMKKIVQSATPTKFGSDHNFSKIKTYQDFKSQVPVKDYEGLKTYIDETVAGKENILWPGKPLYFAKTSGTTSGVKYIPISKESIGFHINSARNALLCYIAETGNANFVDGKLIFLSGSPEMEKKNGIFTGRLSGIVNHHVPGYLRTNQMPSYETNCMEDWEKKVEKITDETIDQNMTLISGIPPWVQMYFDKIKERTSKPIKDVFPNFNLFVYGGVNFEPYRAKLEQSIGKKVDTIETYPASEGFIAYQDSQEANGLLLLVNNGIFFEFIPVSEFFDENPTRLSLADIELDVNYAIILTTNAGLYGYSIGDTVKFVSKNPYRIKVTGRIKHYISAFGEHVIGEEVEEAMLNVANFHGIGITEFTVAPQVNPPEGGLPYHEWLVSFETAPTNLVQFAQELDKAMQQKNIYYKDLIDGSILQPLKVKVLPTDAFINYMKSQGKLGGQNKVPRLSNDRKIAELLISQLEN